MGKGDPLRRGQGNQINEGEKRAHSAESAKDSRAPRRRCEARRRTKTFAVISLDKNENGRQKQTSVARGSRDAALRYTV